jgi:hypothetical protein
MLYMMYNVSSIDDSIQPVVLLLNFQPCIPTLTSQKYHSRLMPTGYGNSYK